ncbi:MAG: M48 family metalloprotease, partial [Anaerolineae bacterium]
MTARTALYVTIALILLSPAAYFGSGVGQRAHTLSAEPVTLAGGSLESSPKAEARHSLSLPIRVEQLLLYPALMLLLHYSGAAAALRRRLAARWVPPLQNVSGVGPANRLLGRLSRNRLSLPEVWLIVLYLTLVSAGVTLLYFPFSVYTGFVLRHQFDLSTQTLEGWLRDFWLGWGVSLLTTLLLYGGFYILLRLAPRRWPVWAGAGFTLFTFGYILLEPVAVTPLFYTVTPVTDAGLRQRINVMADRAGVAIDDISIIDASSKTTAINAYFTGFGGASKIVLWDTLLQKHPPGEVDVVIAHEMGHWVYRHTLIYALGGSAGVWLGLFALRWWLNRVWRGLGWNGPGDVAGYPYLLGVMALLAALSLPL